MTTKKDYGQDVGSGGLWVKQGKKGKFLSWSITFRYNGHLVTASGLGFKSKSQPGPLPSYSLIVKDALPTPSKTPQEARSPGNHDHDKDP